MTDRIEHDDDFDEEDPRVQLLESLADGLATLSEASDCYRRPKIDSLKSRVPIQN